MPRQDPICFRLGALLRVLALGLVSGALVSCAGVIPKDGPTGTEVRENAEIRLEDAGRLSYAFIKLSPLVLASIQTERQSPVIFSGMSRTAGVADVKIGASDVLSVSIFEASSGGLFIPAESGARPGNFVQIPAQEIDRQGNINVPYTGPIRAVGRTPREVEQEIVERLKNRAIEPQAVVTIGERTSNGVSVLGDVFTPVLIPLRPGGIRLLAAIARAGGSRYQPHDTVVHLQRRGRTEQALLSEILRDPKHNIQLAPDDVVYALAQPRTFLVFGATPTLTSVSVGAIVQSGRRFPFDSDNLTLAEGLAKAGGLIPERADSRSVFLFRYMPRELLRSAGVDVSRFAASDVPTVVTVDLSDAEGYLLANQFFMKHKDIIFVSEAPSVDLAKVLSVVDSVTTTTRGVVGAISDIKDLRN